MIIKKREFSKNHTHGFRRILYTIYSNNNRQKYTNIVKKAFSGVISKKRRGASKIVMMVTGTQGQGLQKILYSYIFFIAPH
ncbi:hypothetical protein Cpar_1437 [Chlorobaculum parvum NCIB 8327]|uniref:Uncharacterized protein n=1 Tax=Chlorobaculum parvum (strain DSM 263 / NCIMB 8327) TaxID=517417 RepID=B3QPI3_CHLP8|nr:hypothetical protein Cpar_1437 [Chlorobaculum parvum NCIB 8327]